jgi:hypothetical protein
MYDNRTPRQKVPTAAFAIEANGELNAARE